MNHKGAEEVCCWYFQSNTRGPEGVEGIHIQGRGCAVAGLLHHMGTANAPNALSNIAVASPLTMPIKKKQASCQKIVAP